MTHTNPRGPRPVFADAARSVRLYCGDSLVLLQSVRDACFDMVFADPPYFLSNDGVTCVGGRRVSVNKGAWDKAPSLAQRHEFNYEAI